MRTASEILDKWDWGNKADIIEAMYEYAEEAILECSERARSGWIRFGTNMGHAVEKESILSLIKELK